MAGGARGGARGRGARSAPHFLLEQLIGRGAPLGARRCPTRRTRPTSTPSRPTARRRTRATAAIEHRIRSYIRWNALAIVLRANKESSRARRPHRELPVGGARSTTSASCTSGTRRPRSHGGDLIYVQGHCSPGIYARALPRGPARARSSCSTSARKSTATGCQLLSASVADARLLAVPDRVDGPRPDHGDLPGALPASICTAAASPTPRTARSGRSWATARCDEPESLGAISLAGAREARQPDLRHQLQPAAPRRPGARQRQDHPGARRRSSAAPAGTSSR